MMVNINKFTVPTSKTDMVKTNNSRYIIKKRLSLIKTKRDKNNTYHFLKIDYTPFIKIIDYTLFIMTIQNTYKNKLHDTQSNYSQ